MLEKEFEYYMKNQNELVKQYEGKYIVIIEEEVIGQFDTETEAFEVTTKKHEPGTFLIQLCTPGEQAYTQTFYTRAHF